MTEVSVPPTSSPISQALRDVAVLGWIYDSESLRPLTRFLLQITDDLDFGEKYEGKPLHSNRKELLLRYLQGRCYLIYPRKSDAKGIAAAFSERKNALLHGIKG